ncbi:Ion transport protein [Seminavis robusta]|uniref:Ion transport protein n=1 Tax=Seminavis robusta TaxID=568900 RepID=A0A9N8E491_9STRA|nr:Ion transport protein [Seminavis robusta]|eukprot:Sro649_g181150.1 Ion transport protein (852) ;mRNA; f:10978-13533
MVSHDSGASLDKTAETSACSSEPDYQEVGSATPDGNDEDQEIEKKAEEKAEPSLTFKEKVQRQRRLLSVSFREDVVVPRRRRSRTAVPDEADGGEPSEAVDHARRAMTVSFQEDEVPVFGDGRRRRRRREPSKTRQSYFGSISSSFISGIMDSLREEEVRLDPGEMDDHATRASDESSHVPWLDDTIITYSTRTRAGSMRKKCGKIVNHPCTQHVILFMITANAILMGIMTFDFVDDNPQVHTYLVYTDYVFLGLFAIEVILQLIYHGRSTFGNPWLCFDAVILACSWVPSLRIFRFARVINRLSILKNLTEAIALVMPQMFSIMLFLLIIIYTYAVLFTELFRHVVFEETQYFENLFASMFTCFEMTTMEWAHIAWELKDQNYSWIPITSFVVICGMIFFNLVLAVICNAVAALGIDLSGRNQRELETLAELRKKVRDAEKRVYRVKELMRQLIRNQNHSLHLLEVMLAQKLNSVETWSKLMGEVEDESMSMSQRRTTRTSFMNKISFDYAFQEETMLNKTRILAGQILESDRFDMFIFIVICSDCTMMGVATFEFVSGSDRISGIFEIVSMIFLLIYTLEAGLGFLHNGVKYLSDWWHVFDFFIVVTSWIFDLLNGFKTFREFRAVRIVRAFRLITVLHPLRDLVVAIGTAIPRVSRIMPLLLLLFYIFAVLFVELFRDVQFDDGFKYFDRLDSALFTCLQMMTMEWAELAREATEKSNQQWARGLIVLFVVLSGMLFFDLIKATVCDSVALINGRSRRLAQISMYRKKLGKLGKTIDGISLKMVHTINFQQHINRMLMYDIQTIKSDERKRQSKGKGHSCVLRKRASRKKKDSVETPKSKERQNSIGG